MEALVDIASKAIADYGFRQAAMWSPDDVIAQWDLSQNEANVLKGPLRQALEALPIPVGPEDVPDVQRQFASLISDSLNAS